MWSVGAGGVLLVGGIGLAMVMAEPTKGPVFIAGDQPVTEDQVRQKLQSDGRMDRASDYRSIPLE